MYFKSSNGIMNNQKNKNFKNKFKLTNEQQNEVQTNSKYKQKKQT